MTKQIKLNYTEDEFRKIIREEVIAALDEKMNPNEESYMDMDQAAEFLKIAKPTLYSKTSAGEIPFTKKGKKLLFRRSELEDWLK